MNVAKDDNVLYDARGDVALDDIARDNVARDLDARDLDARDSIRILPNSTRSRSRAMIASCSYPHQSFTAHGPALRPQPGSALLGSRGAPRLVICASLCSHCILLYNH